MKEYLMRGLRFIFKGIPIYNITPEISVLAPNQLLINRCALITGGTSGIGFAIAKAFLQSGADVIITGRSAERLEKAKTELESIAPNRKVFSITMDNTNIATMEDLFLKLLEENKIKKIDILVNNAGILGGTLPNASEKEYDQVLDTNLKGVFFLSQLVGKYMVRNKIHGNILNIASSSSLRPAVSAYTISKWGLRGLTLGLARSLAPHGIVVNGIAPGPTATPMFIKGNISNIANENNLAGRFAIPEEISNMAVMLVSNMGRMIIGDIIYMTGGAGLISFEDMNYNNFSYIQ